jgi:hypothetical protein
MAVVKNIEEFNIGDCISQSKNVYKVIFNDTIRKRVRVKHLSMYYECEFDYGAHFVLVKEVSNELPRI